MSYYGSAHRTLHTFRLTEQTGCTPRARYHWSRPSQWRPCLPTAQLRAWVANAGVACEHTGCRGSSHSTWRTFHSGRRRNPAHAASAAYCTGRDSTSSSKHSGRERGAERGTGRERGYWLAVSFGAGRKFGRHGSCPKLRSHWHTLLTPPLKATTLLATSGRRATSVPRTSSPVLCACACVCVTLCGGSPALCIPCISGTHVPGLCNVAGPPDPALLFGNNACAACPAATAAASKLP